VPKRAPKVMMGPVRLERPKKPVLIDLDTGVAAPGRALGISMMLSSRGSEDGRVAGSVRAAYRHDLSCLSWRSPSSSGDL